MARRAAPEKHNRALTRFCYRIIPNGIFGTHLVRLEISLAGITLDVTFAELSTVLLVEAIDQIGRHVLNPARNWQNPYTGNFCTCIPRYQAGCGIVNPISASGR